MSTELIHPLAGAVAAAGQAQEVLSSERTRTLQRDRQRLRVSSVDPSTSERQVELAAAVDAIHPELEDKPPQQHKPHPHNAEEETADEPGEEHLDVQA